MRDLRRFYGNKRTEPDFEDLRDIFIRLFNCTPDTIYILDGLDALNETQIKSLLNLFRLLFCCSEAPRGSRILLLSREYIPGADIAKSMPGIRQISTSSNVMRDIEVYIETTIADKTMYKRKLTDDPLLLQQVKRILATESSGM